MGMEHDSVSSRTRRPATAAAAPVDLETLEAARVFDGGDLDCGSGLALLIREHMLQVPRGEVLELRSREPTVEGELPPWCRLVGHGYLGSLELAEGGRRYFVRRGLAVENEAESLDQDRSRAAEYEWRARVRGTGPMESTAYCRNFSFKVGRPLSFEEQDAHPSAVELMLSALAADLCAGFSRNCASRGLELDDVEISVQGRLCDPLAHLGLSGGDPGFEGIRLRCYASSFSDEDALREVWEQTVSRSPLAATLARATRLELKLAVV